MDWFLSSFAEGAFQSIALQRRAEQAKTARPSPKGPKFWTHVLISYIHPYIRTKVRRMIEVKIRKVGNSSVVTLSSEMLAILDAKEGDPKLQQHPSSA